MLDSRHGRPPLTPYKDQNYLPFRRQIGDQRGPDLD